MAPAVRRAGAEPARGDVDVGVGIRQQVLEVEAAIPLDGVGRQVVASSTFAPRGVLVVLDDGLAAFDLSTPARPRTVGRWPIDDVVGAFHWRRGVVAVSSDGFVNVTVDGAAARVGPECEPVRLLAATSGDDVVYVLTTTALETRSLRLCPRWSVPLAAGGAGGVVRVGNRLVVGGAEGVSVVDLDASGLGAPRRFPLDGVAVVGLERRPRSDGGTVLATLDDGSARMLDVTPNGDVETRARYPNPPWFAGSARLGNVLVRVAGDGRALLVSRFGESRWVGAEAVSDANDQA